MNAFPKINYRSKTFLIFCILIVLNIGLHLYQISYPAEPVFDEAHFATYAAKYALHLPLSDIHPPLGKVLYSAALTFVPQNSYSTGYSFIETSRGTSSSTLITQTPIKKYAQFPYVYLRIISAFFGLLLAISVYAFLKSLTKNKFIPLLGMFLVTLDNALLLETRLILLNGMYLTFGFFALAVFFQQKQRPLLAGILWGLALSVKLTALAFLGPLLILPFLYYKTPEWKILLKNIITFFITGMSVLVIIFLTFNSLLIPINSYLSYSKALLPELNLDKPVVLPNYLSFLNPSTPHLKRTIVDLTVTLSGYSNAAPHPYQSAWYGWPFVYKPMLYFQEKLANAERSLGLVGNPIIWVLVFLSVVISIAMLFKRKNRELQNPEEHRVIPILLGGYFFSLLPFVFVSRPEFLYHYFPALIFGISLLSYMFISRSEKESPARRKFFFIAFIAFVIIGFVMIAPYTYGIASSFFKWFIPPNF